MRALVTGAGGFIGGALTDALETMGHEVVAGIRPGASKRACGESVELPLEDSQAVRATISSLEPELVFHLAMQWQAKDDQWSVMIANLERTQNLLGGCGGAGSLRAFTLVSSGAVYGQTPDGAAPSAEGDRVAPVSEYGLEKALIEMLAAQRALSLDLPLVIVRPFNVTGPREPTRLVVSAVARQVAEVERGVRPPEVETGPLDAMRDFTDVRDVATGIATAGIRADPGELFNVCSGDSTRIASMVEGLLAMSAEPICLKTRPVSATGPQVRAQRGDPRKLESLGWKRRYTLNQSLRDTLDHWRATLDEEGTGDGLER